MSERRLLEVGNARHAFHIEEQQHLRPALLGVRRCADQERGKTRRQRGVECHLATPARSIGIDHVDFAPTLLP